MMAQAHSDLLNVLRRWTGDAAADESSRCKPCTKHASEFDKDHEKYTTCSVAPESPMDVL